MKKPLKIFLPIVVIAVIVALIYAFMKINKWCDGINDEIRQRKEFQLTYYVNMEFNGRVVGKQNSLESYDGHFLRIKCCDGMPQPDFLLQGEYYKILERDNEIVCRTSEEEYNAFQIGDSIMKKKGIENAFQKITDN